MPNFWDLISWISDTFSFMVALVKYSLLMAAPMITSALIILLILNF